MSVNDYKYVWTVVTFSAHNTCKHTIFRCCFNLFLRRFALFCFAFDFVLPSTFWGFSLTIHSLPSPPLPSLSFSLLLSPPLLPFTFLRCRRHPFSRCLCLCRLHAECDGKLSIATWEGAYKLVTLSLVLSLSGLPPPSLSWCLPLSAAYETSSASAALNVKCLDCVSTCMCLCVCSLWEIVEKSDSDSAAATSTATPPPPISPAPHRTLFPVQRGLLLWGLTQNILR